MKSQLYLKSIAAGLVEEPFIGQPNPWIHIYNLNAEDLCFVHTWMLKYIKGQINSLQDINYYG